MSLATMFAISSVPIPPQTENLLPARDLKVTGHRAQVKVTWTLFNLIPLKVTRLGGCG